MKRIYFVTCTSSLIRFQFEAGPAITVETSTSVVTHVFTSSVIQAALVEI